ncbi:hypothetical protein [Microbacterium sp.]|uniref:hypothetical protein n=1 Tax=Microbacterium sp. TaxID=51671 RepID=UPI00260FD11D|nr:hypothetical protein [Microbacterium sp.]
MSVVAELRRERAEPTVRGFEPLFRSEDAAILRRWRSASRARTPRAPHRERSTHPLRVLRNGDGSEVVFTLFRLPDVTDDDFEKDAALVRADLPAQNSV